MNLGDIRSQAKTYLMNTSSDTASLSWSDSELDGYANEAVFYIQQLNEFLVDTAVLDVVANQPTYTVPTNQYQLIRTTARVNDLETHAHGI